MSFELYTLSYIYYSSSCITTVFACWNQVKLNPDAIQGFSRSLVISFDLHYFGPFIYRKLEDITQFGDEFFSWHFIAILLVLSQIMYQAEKEI